MPENCTQNWLQNSGPDIIAKEMLPIHSPRLNPLDFTKFGEVLEVYN